MIQLPKIQNRMQVIENYLTVVVQISTMIAERVESGRHGKECHEGAAVNKSCPIMN